MRRLLVVVASPAAVRARGAWASGAVALEKQLFLCMGSFLDRLNPCPLHWQAASTTTGPPGSPSSTLTSMVKTTEKPWPSCPPPTVCMGPKSLIPCSHLTVVAVCRDPDSDGSGSNPFFYFLLSPLQSPRNLSIPGFLHSQNSSNRSSVRKF